MASNALSHVPPKQLAEIRKQMRIRERNARDHLAEIHCDTDLLLFHLWCATNPKLLEGKGSFKEQHAQHRLTVARTKKLVREIEALCPRLRQAAQDWNIPADQMATLDVALDKFAGQLRDNCALNKYKHAQYLLFLRPAIQ